MRNPFVAESNGRASLIQIAMSYLVVCTLMVAIFWLALAMVGITLDFSFVAQYPIRITDGFVLTIQISLGSLIGSLVIGIPVALLQRSRILPLRCLCSLYVRIIRGTPLLAQIYLFFYIVGTALGVRSRLMAGIIILSVFSGSYIAEIVRGNLNALDAGQLEAARAVGFTRTQTIRYVVIPQLVSKTLPALTGQFASIIKDSSLLSVIAVVELTQTMQEISSQTFNLFGTYLVLSGLYLCLTLPLMFVSSWFERRLTYAH